MFVLFFFACQMEQIKVNLYTVISSYILILVCGGLLASDTLTQWDILWQPQDL